MSRLTNKQNTVIVAMSGGVDSSVAAFLLCERGHTVVGATIDTGFGRGPEQAARICRELGVEHHIIPGRELFREQVIEPFIRSYLAGDTPNPCVDCNARLKFPALLPLMAELGADKLATGHYCRLSEANGLMELRRGVAENKDQSYFLCRLEQSLLRRCLFPLGELDKEQVRQIAAQQGLASAAQKDSFDICFIENGDYRALLREAAVEPPVEGDIVDEQGRVLGRHHGLADYTLGQRRGINVALGYPAYVVGLDRENNRLVLGPREALYARNIRVRDINMLSGEDLSEPLTAQVRIRCQAPAAAARIVPDPTRPGEAEISFEQPVWAPAGGQSAVFYDGELLLGGGYIV